MSSSTLAHQRPHCTSGHTAPAPAPAPAPQVVVVLDPPDEHGATRPCVASTAAIVPEAGLLL
jgi:hypothetical protein